MNKILLLYTNELKIEAKELFFSLNSVEMVNFLNNSVNHNWYQNKSIFRNFINYLKLSNMKKYIFSSFEKGKLIYHNILSSNKSEAKKFLAGKGITIFDFCGEFEANPNDKVYTIVNHIYSNS